MTIPTTIKAAVTENSKLVIKQVPRPVAEKGTAIVKAVYIGINYADLHQIHGKFFLPPTNIIGLEAAGEVVEIGEGVTEYQVGDRVLAITLGSHAEYFVINNLGKSNTKITDGVSYEKAISLGLQAMTAITLVNKGYVVQKGDAILVHAAAGGVGSSLVQLIHQKGATVIGTVGSDEKTQFAKRLGADHIINYKNENILERVLELTEGQGVHAALDSIGGETFDNSIKAVRYNGVAISFGTAAAPVNPIDMKSLMQKNIRVQGSNLWAYLTTQEEAEQWWGLLFDLIKKNQLKETIYKMYSFDHLQEAYDDISGGQTFGKLLVKID